MNAQTSLLAQAHLFEISPWHVDEGTRIGFLHEDKAAALGRLMAVDGQRDPIKVVANPADPDRPWRLVTGMHRLFGARIEGITVFAIEVSGEAEDLADLEASENLHRRPLGPIERAKFVAALCDAARLRLARQHGNIKQQQLAIKARWDKVKAGKMRSEKALQDEAADTWTTMDRVYGWQESVVDAIGLSPSAIKRALLLHRFLIAPFPDLMQALAAHPVVGENDKQLRDIASVENEAQRRQVLELLLGDNELSADGALILAGIGTASASAAEPVAHQKYWDQIEGGWARLGRSERLNFIPRLADMLGTPGLKRAMRDQLNKELGDV